MFCLESKQDEWFSEFHEMILLNVTWFWGLHCGRVTAGLCWQLLCVVVGCSWWGWRLWICAWHQGGRSPWWSFWRLVYWWEKERNSHLEEKSASYGLCSFCMTKEIRTVLHFLVVEGNTRRNILCYVNTTWNWNLSVSINRFLLAKHTHKYTHTYTHKMELRKIIRMVSPLFWFWHVKPYCAGQREFNHAGGRKYFMNLQVPASAPPLPFCCPRNRDFLTGHGWSERSWTKWGRGWSGSSAFSSRPTHDWWEAGLSSRCWVPPHSQSSPGDTGFV